MTSRSRFLENPINWSFRAGRLFGVTIRLHILFLLGGLVVVVANLRDGGGWTGLVYGAGSLALLFVIVLAHEFGHCYGARRSGGTAREILLWPLGGLATVDPPHNARAHLLTAACGPAVNVAFCTMAAATLWVWTGSPASVPLNPFAPFVPLDGGLGRSTAQHWVVIFFGLSYVILLFNLAPVFPLDGGRILQALLWTSRGYAPAMNMATGIGMWGAIGFAALGIITGAYLLFFIAVFGYATCWQQRQMIRSGMFDGAENEFGYDFSQGYTSIEPTDSSDARRPGYFARRRARREEERRHRDTVRRQAQRRRVDEVLAKLHAHGREALTVDERKLLEHETRRQRATGSD